jgi:hypothetical protein
MSVGLILAIILFVVCAIYFVYQVGATIEHNKHKRSN